MNLFLTIIKFLLLFFITVAALQIGAVYMLRYLQPALVSADLAAIMAGSRERTTSGCKVAVDPGATHLMLANSTLKALTNHAAKCGVPESVTLLPGGKARSSFEDIHVTVQTALERDLTSIILVTSDYHLPRTMFLMFAYNLSIGRELRVQYMATHEQANQKTWAKQLYNEVLKFWGSIFELSGYLITKQPPLDFDKVMKARNWLKDTLLLRV